MRIAYFNLGGRISKTGVTPGSGESYAIIEILARAGATVCAFTKSIQKEDSTLHPMENLHIYDIEAYERVLMEDEFDIMIVMNGPTVFFGGLEERYSIIPYICINKFQGPVFFMMTDGGLPLKQVWRQVKNKEWADKYNEEDLVVTRDDIVYISQFHDMQMNEDIIQPTGVTISTILFYHLEKWIFMYDRLKPVEKTVDLLYGGSYRAGKRQDKMIQYYFGYRQKDIYVKMFGKIKELDFTHKWHHAPVFGGQVKFHDIMDTMNSAIATVIIGDDSYNSNIVTLRVYEAVLANVVVFIDIDFDPYRKIFENEFLRDFLYVEDRDDVYERIQELKHDETLRQKIIDLQYEITKIDKQEYGKGLLRLIKESIND